MKKFTQKEYNDYHYVKQNDLIFQQVMKYNDLLSKKIYIESLLREDSPDELWNSYNDISERMENMKQDSIEKYWNDYYSFLDKLE